MRVGVFTALLSQLPLDEVPKKLKAMQINTVELATRNDPQYPQMIDGLRQMRIMEAELRATASRAGWMFLRSSDGCLRCGGSYFGNPVSGSM
jgi:sugar phosphate isomerase/epimerase